MKRGILFIIITVFTIMLNGCSWAYNMPEAKITLRVIGENGEPIENAEVSSAFERPGGKSIRIKGATDSKRKRSDSAGY